MFHLPIPVRGTIERPVELFPTFFQFGDVHPSLEEKMLTVLIKTTSEQAPDIAPAYLDDGLKWRGLSESPAAAALAVNFADVKTDDFGRFQIQAVLFDRNAPLNKWQIGVIGRRRDWIELSPRAVFVGNTQPGEAISATIAINNRTSGTLRAEFPDPLVVQGNISDDKLQLVIRSPEAGGLFRTNVLVLSDHQSVVLPIAGVVKEDLAKID